MNAAIRGVVRAAVQNGCQLVGIRDGYTGMLEGQFEPMAIRSVGNIIQRGGTILGTSRCMAFYQPEGRAQGAEQLRRAGIDNLIVIGGDGSFQGAAKLHEEHGIPVVGIPGTIDNDCYGTDETIGFDTAVNTALDGIDRLRDTAESHGRVFFVEVMGRRTGHLALEVGLAGGAIAILVPEIEDDLESIVRLLQNAQEQGRKSSIVVVAEGDTTGGVFTIQQQVQARINVDSRVTVLGHLQRGGAPSARDRVLGGRLGAAAVHAILAGRDGCMVGEVCGHIVETPLQETWERSKPLSAELVNLMYELSG
ncbi:MAG: 6-phosphofructokinase [Dehalococcoidia bacterium]|nr:6-phosphofructokinase [Dehalococcoidia bacterium]